MTPKSIGRYDVQGLLGSGGIGQVYVARDRELGRLVAIKALRPEYSTDPAFLQRFRAEAANLAALSHPNITTLYDLQPEGQRLYMIMELVRGHTLEAVLGRAKRLGLRESLAVVAQAVAGLGYAHRMGVIHRDIKPANLMLTESGLLKIMDFGIARVRGSQRLTRVGSIVGTLAYVAPEQIKGGEGDERSDLYSLACVLYELLSGDPPFNADTEYDLRRAQVEARPPPLANLVAGLTAPIEQALLRALEKDPDQRFASVEAFGRALGIEAVQGQANDIVRANVLATPGLEAPAQTRLVAQPAERDAVMRPAEQTPEPPRQALHAQHARRLPGPIRKYAPILVLGAVTAALVIGFGFVLLQDNGLGPVRPTGNHVIAVPTEGQHADNAPTTAVPCSDMILNCGSKQKPATETKPGEHTPQQSVTHETKEAGIVNPPRKPEPPAVPTEQPTYRGPWLGWTFADHIVLPPASTSPGPPRFMTLFGIESTPNDQAKAIADHARLEAFRKDAGGNIACYARDGNTVQCFAGDKDIALWAVRNGLAKFRADAPADYRQAMK